jgi:hypothetical protein
MPALGREKLASLDPAEDFTDPPTRRAAAWLSEHFDAPLDDLPAGDEELAGLVNDLFHRAKLVRPEPASLEASALRLEIARVERRIAAGDGHVADLASQRVQLKERLDLAIDKAMA